MTIATTGAGEIAAGVAIVVGVITGAAAIAQLARGSFTKRRQNQRREDSLWGYHDVEGSYHRGVVDDVRHHVANKRIHLYDHGDPDDGAPGDGGTGRERTPIK